MNIDKSTSPQVQQVQQPVTPAQTPVRTQELAKQEPVKSAPVTSLTYNEKIDTVIVSYTKQDGTKRQIPTQEFVDMKMALMKHIGKPI